MSEAEPARSWSWRWPARGVWLGSVAFVLSLSGTELLRRECLRTWALLLLLAAAVLAVLAWSEARWSLSFPADQDAEAHRQTSRSRSALATLAGAVLLSASSYVAFLAAPHKTFGAAGWLWLAGIVAVTTAAALRSFVHARQNDGDAGGSPAWRWWEVAVIASVAVLALALRLWDLRDVPFNIY